MVETASSTKEDAYEDARTQPGTAQNGRIDPPDAVLCGGIELCVTNFWGEDVHCFLPDLSAHGEDAEALHFCLWRKRLRPEAVPEQSAEKISLRSTGSLAGICTLRTHDSRFAELCGHAEADSGRKTSGLNAVLKTFQLCRKQIRVVEDISMAESGKAADGQSGVHGTQFLDGL